MPRKRCADCRKVKDQVPYRHPDNPELRICPACRNRLKRHARGLGRPGPKPDPSAWRSRHNPKNPRRLKAQPEVQRRSRVRAAREEVKVPGRGRPKGAANRVVHTHCPNGHEYTSETVGYRAHKGTQSGEQRYCKICFRNGWRRSRGLSPIPDDTPFVANRNKTHCPAGHEYSRENTAIRANGSRQCRTCVKHNRIRRLYGLEPEQYDWLIQHQGNACAICHADFEETQAHTDHDHETETVRGLLCSNCNNGLGRFEDSLDLLAAAIRYLREAPKVEAKLEVLAA